MHIEYTTDDVKKLVKIHDLEKRGFSFLWLCSYEVLFNPNSGVSLFAMSGSIVEFVGEVKERYYTQPNITTNAESVSMIGAQYQKFWGMSDIFGIAIKTKGIINNVPQSI